LVLKNELNKYKTKYSDIEKKYNEIKNIFDKQMNEKIDVTNKLNKEINSLNEICYYLLIPLLFEF
jgi:archaellum component FlaC